MINVVFEGTTGAGKTTIIKKLKEKYQKKYKVGITNDIDRNSPLYNVINDMFKDNALVSLKENFNTLRYETLVQAADYLYLREKLYSENNDINLFDRDFSSIYSYQSVLLDDSIEDSKEFMDRGDYASAIERLKSSVDLDGNVFETQYNLAVAYTQAEDYANAIKTYGDVIRLNPDFADSYYSLAVCEENLAKDIISGEVVVNDDESIEKAQPATDDETEVKDKKLSDVSVKILNSAEDVYNSADVIAIVTAWEEFRKVPALGNKKIVDCRYML